MRISSIAACGFLAALPLAAQPPAGPPSPFLPPSAAGTGAMNGPGEIYELSGASSTDAGTEICLYDTATKHSRWLTVGQNDDGIQVISYDGANDQAVVRFDGRTHVLALRQSRTSASFSAGIAQAGPLPAGSSAAANAPIVDPSTIGKSPETIKQEREARMLVSDLLEISIKQRKAYEEAQKRAAAQKSAGGS